MAIFIFRIVDEISLLYGIAYRLMDILFYLDRNSRYKDWIVQIFSSRINILHGNNPINGQYFQITSSKLFQEIKMPQFQKKLNRISLKCPPNNPKSMLKRYFFQKLKSRMKLSIRSRFTTN